MPRNNNNSAPIEPPKELFAKVMKRIHKEERFLAIKRRVAFFSFIMACSAVFFIPAVKMVQAELSESEFAQFFSLLFSDFGIMMASWQSFSLALLESLPVTSIAVFSAVLFAFFGSLRFLTRDIKTIIASAKFKAV